MPADFVDHGSSVARRAGEAVSPDKYLPGFAENHGLRSNFIRELTLQQLAGDSVPGAPEPPEGVSIPRTVVQFWNDTTQVPADVRQCMDSWQPLARHGLTLLLFDDASAMDLIAERYGPRELAAFKRCTHPAMRSDYFRLCYILAEGGLYVDADDVLIGSGWSDVFRDPRLKVQTLCYDIPTERMVPASEVRRPDLATEGRIFYLNNNPIAAPPGHPVLRRALVRSTEKLLAHPSRPEIQETTGPGNLTVALAEHARKLQYSGGDLDYELLLEWEETAEPRWELEYRADDRNWRNHGRAEDDGYGADR